MLNVVPAVFYPYNHQERKCCVSKISWKITIFHKRWRQADRRELGFLEKSTLNAWSVFARPARSPRWVKLPPVQVYVLTGSFLDFMEILFVIKHADRRVCCTTVISDRPRHFELAAKTAGCSKYQLVRISCQVSMLFKIVWF